MKIYSVLILILSGLVLTSVFVHAADSKNPFFKKWNTPLQTPPFSEIKTEHYIPAIEEGIKQQKKEIEAIVSSKDKPDYKNTIEALEKSGKLLTKVNRIYGAMNSACADEGMQKISEKVVSLLAEHNNDKFLNEKLFSRIKYVYDNKESLKLTAEQNTVLENYYLDFTAGGAALHENGKARLREINNELAQLVQKFGDNVRNENSRFELIIDRKEDLAGLTEASITDAAVKAEKKGMKGKWIFTIDKPTLIPFLQYSSVRELRKKMYYAYVMRGNNNNDLDNKSLFSRIISLRVEKANLLGYKRYSDLVTKRKMSKTPENVMKFLNEMWTPTVKRAEAEAADMQRIIDSEGGSFKLEPYDWWYYSEKVKKEKYDLDENMLRPYFSIDNVVKGAFDVAGKLYGIKFRERKDIQIYHPEVKVFEVTEKNGKLIGILYTDYFPRPEKSGGAWCDAFREQNKISGSSVVPLIYNVGNFSKPTAGQPALLSVDEVSTLFHEFGHGLHGLFQNIHYPSASAVPTDFAELPSQIMENWAMQPEVLKSYAKHYKTGEVISDELIKKVGNSIFFNQGFETLEYIAASILDMDYHMISDTKAIDIDKFEKESIKKMGLVPQILPRYMTTNFIHIATWGYESGYYSYLWSAILDSDAFGAFTEKGLFDRQTAESFRREVLEKAGSLPLMPQYIKFRGREPKVDALLKARGLN